jgi:hypothetical protein
MMLKFPLRQKSNSKPKHLSRKEEKHHLFPKQRHPRNKRNIQRMHNISNNLPSQVFPCTTMFNIMACTRNSNNVLFLPNLCIP